jgi:purine-binding chemotaxis protein CheW
MRLAMNRQFITSTIDDHLIGLDITKIREIYNNLDIYEVPLSPDYIRGLVNLRGQIITVFDLRVRLGFKKKEITEQNKLIVLKEESVGFLVDSIGDVIESEEKNLVVPPAYSGQIEEEFLEGILKYDDELLIILSTEKILFFERKD